MEGTVAQAREGARVKITTRREWGARPPRCRDRVSWPNGVDLWIHHLGEGDGPSATASPSEEAAFARGIQNFHMDNPNRHWCDIGYAYLIFESGRVYEGRGFEVEGAHSPGKNGEPSACLMGTYSTQEPTQAQRLAVWDLVNEIDAGDLRGHRENTQTSCPGDAAMRFVVNAPQPDRKDGLTLKQRLMAAGLGGRSADALILLLNKGHEGTIPNPTDSRLFRRLRDVGFGVTSARQVIRAGRAPFPSK